MRVELKRTKRELYKKPWAGELVGFRECPLGIEFKILRDGMKRPEWWFATAWQPVRARRK